MPDTFWVGNVGKDGTFKPFNVDALIGAACAANGFDVAFDDACGDLVVPSFDLLIVIAFGLNTGLNIDVLFAFRLGN